jgi:hypothetical protein
MTNRLPTPGGDSGDWGEILNSFLEVSLASDGTLNPSVVGTAQLEANSVTNTQLDSPTQTTLASVAGKYTLPNGGIPASDMNSSVQSNLTLSSTSLQPGVTVTGDLSGTLPSPTVAKIKGITLPSSAPTSGQVLQATSSNATNWATVTSNGTVNNATTSAPGLIELAGDLGGTNTSATSPILAATSNVENIISSNVTVAGATQKSNNLSDLSSATTARTNLGLGTAATISSTAGGDLSGTLPSPTVAKIQGTTISSPSGGATSYLNAIGTWTTPIGSSNASSIDGVDVTGTPSANQVLTASSSTAASWTTQAAGASNATTSTPGLVELAGDLSGTATAPTVTSTHLTSALPLAQGGTGSTTQNFVDLSSSQTIAGTKTFSSPIAGSITGNAATATTATSAGSATTATNSTTAATATATNALNSATTTVVVNGATAPTSGQVLTASSSTAASWTTPSASTSGAQALVPTAVKTSAYTASPGDFVPVDASGGSVTITLPTAPADKSRVEVKMINTAVNATNGYGNNYVTFSTGSGDVLNKSSGSTSGYLTILNQAAMLQYASSSAIWYIQSDDLPSTSVVLGISHTVTTSYNLTNTDHVLMADATSAAFTVTLPTAVGFNGRYTIDAISTGTNIVTLATTSSQTIDGASTITLGTQVSGATYSSVDLISDGANWRVV